MSRIYWRKNVPSIVREWFERNFPDCSLSFYSYQGMNGKTYGCMVYKNSKLYSYAHQGTEQEFATRKEQ